MMLSVWIAACLFLGFSLQTCLVVLVNGSLSLGDCPNYQYKLKGGIKCIDCPKCPAGQQYTTNCGYKERNGKLTKPGKSCRDCLPGQYKSSASPYECDKCTKRCPEGTKMIHPCNKTHDMECSKCSKGFYTLPDGSCGRCSPCCGTPSIYTKHFVQKECEDAGMLTCSCSPMQGCQNKTEICEKQILKFSRENPSRKTSPSPTTTSTIKKTQKKNITTKVQRSSTRVPVTHEPTFPALQPQKDKGEEEDNGQSFVTGWLVATVIGVVLVAAIVFQVLKHFNILKKIKSLLKPREEVVDDESSHSVITVAERYESPSRPVITNYAQRMLPEEEDEMQSDRILPHHALLNRSSAAASYLDHDEFAEYDPWVLRDPVQSGATQMRPMSRPLTRAEVAMNPLYGEYIEIMPREDDWDDFLSTQGNNSGSLRQLDESSSVFQDMITGDQLPQTEDTKEMMKVKIDDKPGQEHSDDEEASTSIPATASGENTFIIATGQHRETIHDDFLRKEMSSKRKRDQVKSSGKRIEKHREKEKLASKILGDDNIQESEDVLQCTCGDCSYRPYVREKQLCYCTDCVPQPTDDLYNIIERRCLRAEICRELNKKGVPSWRDLCTYIRIDKEITNIEKEENPAEVVLEKLKTSRPRLQLQDFSVILNRIKRQDIMEMIMQHHVKCMLCRRNSFDGSLGNVHLVSDSSTTWISSKSSAL